MVRTAQSIFSRFTHRKPEVVSDLERKLKAVDTQLSETLQGIKNGDVNLEDLAWESEFAPLAAGNGPSER